MTFQGNSSYFSIKYALYHKNCIVPFSGPVILFTRERNGMTAHRSTLWITFKSVPISGMESYDLNRSRVKAAPRRTTFWNETTWNGTQSLPCGQGLFVKVKLI